MGFENFDFGKLFSLERIFEGSPGASFQFYQEALIIFGLFFFIGIAISVFLFLEKNKIKKRLFRKIKSLMFWVSSLGFLYIFMRFQNIYLFSSRSFLYLLFLFLIIRLGFIGYYYFINRPKELDEHREKEELKKYIPKPKKKGKK